MHYRWNAFLLMIGFTLTMSSVVTAKPPEAEDAKPASKSAWQSLFEKETWYKQQAGKEVVFHGKLEAIPQAGGFSTLQRTSHYKLGSRNLYTGARKLPVLDKLVGKQVELKGKAVDFRLEGQNVREIWPAAVRASAGPPKTTKLKSTGKLGGCTITITKAAGDIDGSPNGDGKLLVNAYLKIDNKQGKQQQLTLLGFVRDKQGQDHAINWKDAATGKPVASLTKANEVKNVTLFAKESLPVRGTCRLIVGISDATGNTLWLQSDEVRLLIAR